MLSSSIIALALSFLAVTLASPVARGSPYYCQVEYSGVEAEIVSTGNGLEWVPYPNVGQATVSEAVSLVGQVVIKPYHGVFTIAPASDTYGETALEAINNDIVTEHADPNNPFQQYYFNCLSCYPTTIGLPFAEDCLIQNVGNGNFAQIGQNIGDAVTTVDVNDAVAQLTYFNLIAR